MSLENPNDFERFTHTDKSERVIVPINSASPDAPVKFAMMFYSTYRRAMELGAALPWWFNTGVIRTGCDAATGGVVGINRVIMGAKEDEQVKMIDNRIKTIIVNGREVPGVLDYTDGNLRIVPGNAKRRDIDPLKKERGRA